MWVSTPGATQPRRLIFHQGCSAGGERPNDIYRRISSGINGTPMPAFEKLFQDNPDAIWQLVHFIRATGERRRQGKPPLSEADLPSTPATTAPAGGLRLILRRPSRNRKPNPLPKQPRQAQ